MTGKTVLQPQGACYSVVTFMGRWCTDDIDKMPRVYFYLLLPSTTSPAEVDLPIFLGISTRELHGELQHFSLLQFLCCQG